ncbi:6-hydroxy-D-nicotine oxidase [Fusarium heterosporum]|uniref:6-hydroxy-D-nicotine oxidase n=1 Tax=Fusarium heterosporum TaxID=42747 RepID=A0A8H5T6V8_FUSHE|nr:6-hydroxy-D-nicotine oxidase [Fusarium heterosporum]
MTASISGFESLQCDFTVPNDSTPKLSRWSDTNVDRPALIVTPKNEHDIQTAICIAKDNKLTIVTGGGGHGTFVSVDSKTLYLDMKHFKTIELNKEHQTARVGGGALVGEVLKALTVEGCYTPIPNSDAVGFVGCVLGSGNGVLIGLHGFMVDNIVSFRLVTAGGDILEVKSSSKGKELALFNALCGAGHGLAVVTEVTTSIYPLPALNLDEGDRIWTRTLIFPAPAIDVAAEAFLDLKSPLPEGYVTMAFARSPPGTPAAGAPIIVLNYQFFGPAEKGEKEAALLFQEELVGTAVMKITDLLPFVKMNYKNEVYNFHGGHKAIASARLYKTDLESIKSGFNRWLAATQEYPDAQQTALIMSAYNTAKSVENSSDKFAENRDRSLNVFIAFVTQEEKTRQAFTGIMNDIVAGYRKGDEGATPRSFPNNLRFEMELDEMFDEGRLQVLRDIKTTWDADGVFWSPYSEAG